MIIDYIHITKFHGFKDVGFKLGTNITIIAGQNGTQKTTLLGLLSQPFSLKIHPQMKDERPLCGGNYWSQYSEKFKLSPTFDKKGEHEWTINSPFEDKPFTVESIYRDQSNGVIRFWKKGDRDKGSGYLQYPVIYLSLKRLIPIGEETAIYSKQEQFTEAEITLFKKLHNQILISFDKIVDTNVIESSNKTTLGVTTDTYDWMQNSAGQDNVGKIILALLSFKRLKEKYGKTYKGGILLIDELDATMYPGSQQKLLEVLQTYSSKYNIQVVFTTHSLMLLELGHEMVQRAQEKEATKDSIKLIYLEKKDDSIAILEDMPFAGIVNRLKVSVSKEAMTKVLVYSEDSEATMVMKALLRGHTSKLTFSKCAFGCGNLINLMQTKVPSFCFPDSIILLDGDVNTNETYKANLAKIKKPNWLILPTQQSPERFIAEFLNTLSDKDPFWTSIHQDYTRQVCFKEHRLEQILQERKVAKHWFQQQLNYNKSWCSKALKAWIKSSPENATMVTSFVNNFVELYNRIATELRIPAIQLKK